jgi:hypothetical protein
VVCRSAQYLPENFTDAAGVKPAKGLDASDTPESKRAWRTLPYYGLTTCRGSWPASERAMFSADSIMILRTLSGDRPAM